MVECLQISLIVLADLVRRDITFQRVNMNWYVCCNVAAVLPCQLIKFWWWL